jgi:hypothetical protein
MNRRHLVLLIIAAWLLIGVHYAALEVTSFRTESQGSAPYGRLALYYLLRSTGWIVLTWIVVALIDRQPATRMTLKMAVFVVAPAVTLAALADVTAHAAIQRLIWAPRPFLAELEAQLPGGFHTSLLWIFLITAVGHGVRYHHVTTEARLRESRLETALVQARLQTLANRTQPHFLFNALNSISALVRTDPEKAETMISRLGDLLRTSMRADDAESIPLAEELALVRQYLAIQQIRYSDRMQSPGEVTVEATEEAARCLVPRFILQPLVENAIKHGVEPLDEPAEVSVRGHVQGDRLVLTVTNSASREVPPFETSDGIGLRATKERLALIYGDAQTFAIRHWPEGRVEATIGVARRKSA